MDCDSPSAGDPVVGLEVDSKIFYFHRSALLMSGSSYFASLLGDRWETRADFRDARGRDVFFVGGCSSSVFEYIHRFLHTMTVRLPKDSDLSLLQLLREEALFFGLDGLTEILKTPRTFSPINGNKGVLHWLGTEKGTAEYTNPYLNGAVHVGGWVDVKIPADAPQSARHFRDLAGSPESRAAFVHHHQKLLISLNDDTRVHIQKKMGYGVVRFCDGTKASCHQSKIYVLEAISLFSALMGVLWNGRRLEC